VEKLSEDDIKQWVNENEILIIFFKTDGCGVCQAQLPVIEQIGDDLEVPLRVVNLSVNRHIAASQMVLSSPITKVFDRGREFYKQGAFIDFNKLRKMLQQLQQSQQG